MSSIVVVRRSASGRQDKRVHGSPADVSCKTGIFASLRRWTNMSNPSSVPLKFRKGYLSNTKEISDGMLTNVKRSQWWFGLAGVNRKARHGGASFDHTIWV